MSELEVAISTIITHRNEQLALVIEISHWYYMLIEIVELHPC